MVHSFAARHGLHSTDARALLAIMEADGQGRTTTPGALCQELDLTSGAVTAAVDRLERKDHIRRTRESSDRRQVQLKPTDSARAVAKDFFGGLATRSDRVLVGLSEDELVLVRRFLAQMNSVMRDFRAEMDNGTRA